MKQARFEKINLIAAISFNAIILMYAIVTVVIGPNDGPGVPTFEAHVLIIASLQVRLHSSEYLGV
jgi:hypothetical protein